jgi:hypothetical protein
MLGSRDWPRVKGSDKMERLSSIDGTIRLCIDSGGSCHLSGHDGVSHLEILSKASISM